MTKLSYYLFLIFLFLQSIASQEVFNVRSPFILLGEECTDNSQCTSGNIPDSYCTISEGLRTGYCHCMEGFVPSHDRKRCLPSNIHIGGQCDETQQCTGHTEGKSVCLPGSGICECKSGYIQNHNMTDCLVKINTLGSRICTEDVQCQLGKPGRLSYCAGKLPGPYITGERVCKCKPEAVDGVGGDANRCHKKAKNFGDKCKLQAQCTSTLKNSICMKGQCEKHPAYDVWRSRATKKGGNRRRRPNQEEE